MDLAARRGELVSAQAVETRWSGIFAGIKTTALSWPTKAKQRLPHLSAGDLIVLEALVRELLEDLARPSDGAAGP